MRDAVCARPAALYGPDQRAFYGSQFASMPDEAWTAAVAAPGQVPEEQWLELIGLREPGHPADVIGPLRDLIELGIERTSDKYRYPKAIKALKRLRDDYQRAGEKEGFTTYVDELRQRQRRKTAFIAKLDAAFAPTAD